MIRSTVLAMAVTAAAFAAPALAQDAAADAAMTAPPPAPFAKVSELVKLPDFLPGLGTLYVDPATLPAGPFLGFDHDGKLAATIYMTPIKALQDGTAYDNLGVGAKNVESVDILYNAGHPGVEEPHVHVILYHSADSRERLAK